MSDQDRYDALSDTAMMLLLLVLYLPIKRILDQAL